jgi:hypothetical protein
MPNRTPVDPVHNVDPDAEADRIQNSRTEAGDAALNESKRFQDWASPSRAGRQFGDVDDATYIKGRLDHGFTEKV